jgi:hypothetical protein
MLPPFLSPRYFLRYQPGMEHIKLSANSALNDLHVYRLGFDCTPQEVRSAALQVMRLIRAKQDTRLLLPFYATQAIPKNLQKYVASLPSTRIDYPKPTVRLLGDAQGHVHPALAEHFEIFTELGLGNRLAQYEAFRAWAPEILYPLQQFVGDLSSMLRGTQLVRKWEVNLKTRTPWHRTGREFLNFACDFGCVKREGRGRVRWAPFYAHAVSYLTMATH